MVAMVIVEGWLWMGGCTFISLAGTGEGDADRYSDKSGDGRPE